ncbi:MAG: hypothetical protein A3J66_00150 [Candidatus Magasanikbacteria bacterium RIFCSPHIGHO2_02_FULL_47_14]|uniref:DoxX family protein n=1 Tax=Candidatus Magasanikbacteria bacterium RIFCSPHIGHO2_02_FULL_47_14 TaxID=1798680 RepID=A0A1F6LZI2_9BACT|nr:MAG: hypothetical protein A3J66_00150 [Candidatus Magasanikbacteria bacterium RIFCSPHIGHO2_02_FULL_47_14]
MNTQTRASFLFLRLAMGFLFLYAGLSKVTNPDWSAAGFLNGAKTLAPLFHWFALPSNIGWVNALNEWGLTLLGASLIFGICVRLSSKLGIVLMLLYYIPGLDGLYPNTHAFVVDEHIIYIAVLALFASFRVGRFWGFDGWWVERLGEPVAPAWYRILG